MTLLDRHIGWRLLLTVAKALVALVLFYVLIDLLTHRNEDITQRQVPLPVLGMYYLALAPQLIARMLPLAVLVSTLLVLGATAQNNEVTAVFAGGVSLWRFVRAPVTLALLFTAGLFLFQERIGVAAARETIRIENQYFSPGSAGGRSTISWAKLGNDWTCHIVRFNPIALTGEGVVMDSIRDDAVEHLEARRIYWEPDREAWLLEDGFWLVFPPDMSVVQERRRITQAPAPFDEHPERLLALEDSPATKTLGQLQADIAYARDRGMPVGRLQVAYHAKFAQPALCFVMLWIAIPFALRLRRGGIAISFGASVLIAIVYLSVFGIAMELGRVDRIDPVFAAWLANGLFFAGAGVLFVRTPT